MNHNGNVPVVCRLAESGCLEQRESAYCGKVPRKVWERINRHFLKLDAGDYFFPGDPEEAYHDAVRQVEEKAEKICRGELVLVRATLETYLTSVAKLAFLNYHLRKVQPARKTYRLVERKILGQEETSVIERGKNAAEGADVGGEACQDAAEGGGEMQPLTAQQLVECLPGHPSMGTRRAIAAALLDEICDGLLAADQALGMEIAKAFAAYVAAEGNHVAAAHIARIGVNRWYRTWPRWIAAARSVGERVTPVRH